MTFNNESLKLKMVIYKYFLIKTRLILFKTVFQKMVHIIFIAKKQVHECIKMLKYKIIPQKIITEIIFL